MSSDTEHRIIAVAHTEVPKDLRDKILSFEDAMKAFPGARIGNQDWCPLKHTFAGPIYVREIFIPKDTLLTGKIHLHEHPIFLMSGDVSIVDETTGARRIQGPCHFISPPGTKRLIYTHSDTVFVTVHHVGQERDVKQIEDSLTTDSYDTRLPCSESEVLALPNGT